MKEEDIIDIITHRLSGATKSDIIDTIKAFGGDISERQYKRWTYVQSRLGDSYCDGKHWFGMSNGEYVKSLVKFIHNHNHNNGGMGVGAIPTWVIENRELFKETFKPEQF